MHLKHSVQLLSSPVQEGQLERVQQRAMKMIKELEHLSYQERLRELLSLEKERHRGILSMSKNN